MSLSQKHTGKILVPWYSITEWRAVYDMIYVKDNIVEAVQVLRVWKCRTPLLSAGIEGTLIVLDALVIDNLKFSEYEGSHILSTSLIRFLNLCATNSDKQGSFYKVAKKNELPKWLISIRHEIAHSHKLPSKSMLKISLKYCLEWLRVKYWEEQFVNISNFSVVAIEETVLEDLIFLYSHLCEEDVNLLGKELRTKLNIFMLKYNRVPDPTVHIILNLLCGVIKDHLKNYPKVTADQITSYLINNFAILSTACEKDESGTNILSKSLVEKWDRLLNIFNQTHTLKYFISNLCKTLCAGLDMNMCENASLWIKEIYQGLIFYGTEQENALKFHSEETSMKDHNLASEILSVMSPFATNYVKEVLDYNGASLDVIQESIEIIIKATSSSGSGLNDNEIFTINNIILTAPSIHYFNELASSTGEKQRWKLIKDAPSFKNLPLGVLPQQEHNVNPILLL